MTLHQYHIASDMLAVAKSMAVKRGKFFAQAAHGGYRLNFRLRRDAERYAETASRVINDNFDVCSVTSVLATYTDGELAQLIAERAA